MFAGGREGFIRDRSPRRRNSRERIGGGTVPWTGEVLEDEIPRKELGAGAVHRKGLGTGTKQRLI